ncbi:NAD(P)-dependent dehydrogenase (short-subunit alcohol dehydrogenase family) [Microbacterium resistens]|uniref:NAD(P)-dependent dehydrogenase (Short-subunit alcohol dehydrogenase family) n=1 Tax=Microbacterium resistens TaxID=156977 RepID=A0ABU1SEQ7_9MICO|nr:SDR family oxidoreductase [Microbacterium resistens]MDR6868092.1 NAD(P)-dependent dehydrogenase (short-subunit alcohol dehydrogenase family) [Microbacterium resistens]
MSTDLAGLRVLITGGAKGLGLREAQRIVDGGGSVVIADVDEETGTAAAAALRADGGEATFVRLDVTDDASWESGMASAVQALGGLDGLVNNAGIEISDLLVDLDPANMRRVLEVNVLGTALGIKHGFRAMRPGGAGGGGGAIVNTASVAATIAFPGIAAYSASKSAVERLSKVAAAESGRLGYGVRVNTVCPGLVPNAMGAQLAVDMERLGLFPSADDAVAAVIGLTPSGRLAGEEDIANGVAFLLSGQSAFVNGATLSIDGAMGM